MPRHQHRPSKLVGPYEKVETKSWLRDFWTDTTSRSGNSEQFGYPELLKDSKWKNNWVNLVQTLRLWSLCHTSCTLSDSILWTLCKWQVHARHDDQGSNTRESKNNLIVCDILCWFQISPGSLISINWDDSATAHKISATVADRIHLSGLWSKISLLLEEIEINIQYMLRLPSIDSE